MAERKRTDDPALTGGSTASVGGPGDRDTVVYDTRDAVLVEGFETSVAHSTREGVPQEDAVALVVRGRRNRPPDHAPSSEAPRESIEHLHLMSWDAAANLVVDIQSLAARDGFDLAGLLREKWAAYERRGLTKRAAR